MGISVRNINKNFGDFVALGDVSVDIHSGNLTALLGPSGGGKTTLLRILAGLTAADSGSVHINETDVTASTTQARGAVYLYQEPLLFPHLDVFENIAFGLRLRGASLSDLKATVGAMLSALGMHDFARRDPASLSGGQRQRVAFARALVVQPALLLLDEPFSNLDPQARADMQRLCKTLCAASNSTVVFVTHDLKEALVMGDSYGRLADGRYQGYADRAAFCADPASGVAAERAFWRDDDHTCW